MTELSTLASMTFTLTRVYLLLAVEAIQEWVHGFCPCEAW